MRDRSTNDLIRRAVNVMSQDETGEDLRAILVGEVPGLLSGDTLVSNRNDLAEDLVESINHMQELLRVLKREIKAIRS